MDGSNTMVQDEAQHKAKGDGWFESPATARDALEQLARSKPPLESLRFSDNHRLIDAVYEILYKDAKGREQWRIVREYLENFPGAALKSTWAEKPLSLIQQVARDLPERTTQVDVKPEQEHPKGYDGLPQKKTDLSKYIDGARLTERQRDCFSLKYEYRLPEPQIAMRLGLKHHSTVQEHIALAKAKVDMARNRMKSSPPG